MCLEVWHFTCTATTDPPHTELIQACDDPSCRYTYSRPIRDKPFPCHECYLVTCGKPSGMPIEARKQATTAPADPSRYKLRPVDWEKFEAEAKPTKEEGEKLGIMEINPEVYRGTVKLEEKAREKHEGEPLRKKAKLDEVQEGQNQLVPADNGQQLVPQQQQTYSSAQPVYAHPPPKYYYSPSGQVYGPNGTPYIPGTWSNGTPYFSAYDAGTWRCGTPYYSPDVGFISSYPSLSNGNENPGYSYPQDGYLQNYSNGYAPQNNGDGGSYKSYPQENGVGYEHNGQASYPQSQGNGDYYSYPAYTQEDGNGYALSGPQPPANDATGSLVAFLDENGNGISDGTEQQHNGNGNSHLSYPQYNGIGYEHQPAAGEMGIAGDEFRNLADGCSRQKRVHAWSPEENGNGDSAPQNGNGLSDLQNGNGVSCSERNGNGDIDSTENGHANRNGTADVEDGKSHIENGH